MKRVSTLRRYRRRFLVVFVLGIVLYAFASQLSFHAAPAPPGPGPHPAPYQSPLPSLVMLASITAALVGFCGFVVTSVMAIFKERRERALFKLDLELKRLQVEEARAKAVKATQEAAG